MTDETITTEAADELNLFDGIDVTDEPRTVTIDDVVNEAPKRKRGRPKKTESTESETTFDFGSFSGNPETETQPARKRASSGGRRSAKLSGNDVVEMFTMFGFGAAMLTQEEHWFIDPDEVKPFAPQFAAMMNRIPAKYVRMATDGAGYAAAITGVVNVLKPRINQTRVNRAMRRAQREATQNLYAVPTDEPQGETEIPGDDMPWSRVG